MRIFIFSNLSVFLLLLKFGTSTEISKSWIESVLKQDENFRGVKEVLSVKISPTSENETALGSEDTRITMEVILGNGAKTTKSVIMKSLPSTPALNQQIKDSRLFPTEITTYKIALTMMEKLLNEYNDKSEIIWVRHLDLRDYDQLILEDVVGEQGYTPADRFEGLDFEHSKLAVKGLAKIHALSAVVNEFNHTLEEHFGISLLQAEYERLKDFYEVIFNNFAEVIETKWGKEWLPCAEKIRKVAPTVKERLLKLTDDNKGFINVLNLGAPTIRTMYFKYGISDLKELDVPIALKFTYFQLAYFNTPSHDLQYLLNTSPSLHVMTNHREELLHEYFQAFLHYLKVFKFKGEQPTYEEFAKEIERTNFEGITYAIQILPYIYQTPGKKIDYESDAEKNLNSNTTSINTSGMQSAKFEEVIKVLLKKAVDDKVL